MYFKTLLLTLSLTTLSNIQCMEDLAKHLDNGLGGRATCSLNQEFGYTLLAIQWAPSFCANTKCGDRNRNAWTIHGAWPQHMNNSWPQNCCFESTFEASKIKALENEMLVKWPSLKASGTHEAFWKHEWTKHGTCAMESPKLKGHFNYFNHTLSLYNQFPLQQWLSASGIVGSNTTAYKLSAIHNSVEPRLGNKRVELECLTKSPNPLLQHIYICLDKITLKPIDCQRADDKQCGSASVLLPTV